uniref:Uncharacterized protein n=1 Tax=Glypta fumiferanae TaxID=389681 RepID=A0A0F6Q8S4_9HYME|nr:hypothetical protein [Glypta fumiferanae]
MEYLPITSSLASTAMAAGTTFFIFKLKPEVEPKDVTEHKNAVNKLRLSSIANAVVTAINAGVQIYLAPQDSKSVDDDGGYEKVA